jgi:hypothetical protein
VIGALALSQDMDKEQAAQIQRHLLDAADAIDRVSAVLVD